MGYETNNSVDKIDDKYEPGETFKYFGEVTTTVTINQNSIYGIDGGKYIAFTEEEVNVTLSTGDYVIITIEQPQNATDDLIYKEVKKVAAPPLPTNPMKSYGLIIIIIGVVILLVGLKKGQKEITADEPLKEEGEQILEKKDDEEVSEQNEEPPPIQEPD